MQSLKGGPELSTSSERETATSTLTAPFSMGDVPANIQPLLRALSTDHEATDYYRGLIRPLEQYDLDHTSDMLGTLSLYLYYSGNVTHAAQALYLHRSTMLHRLGRISSLLCLDITDPYVRLSLWLAVLLSKNS